MAIRTMTRFLLFLVCLCVLSVSSAAIARNLRSDVSSLFFSPFRVVGKRNQFNGLYAKQASDYSNGFPYNQDYLMF